MHGEVSKHKQHHDEDDEKERKSRFSFRAICSSVDIISQFNSVRLDYTSNKQNEVGSVSREREGTVRNRNSDDVTRDRSGDE